MCSLIICVVLSFVCGDFFFDLFEPFALIDPQALSNGNVYLNSVTGTETGCGSQTTPCKTLAAFLSNNGSNYFNNNFYFAPGTYDQPIISVPSTAPSQTVTFTGQDDNVLIRYNTTNSTYGFVVSMESSIQYTRLNYEFNYAGSASTDRTLVRTNGGTVYANNCTFNASGPVKAAFFRNAYGGTINISRCVFKNVNWVSGAYDFGCIFIGGNISGEHLLTNCTFVNLTAALSTPILPFYYSASRNPPAITTVGNITIYGGLITNISLPKNATVIQISTMFEYSHYTRVQQVTFTDLTQSDNLSDTGDVVDGFIFSLNTLTLNAQSQVTIEGNTFDHIVGRGAGGVVYSSSPTVLSLSRNTFRSCSTTGVGGGALFFDAPANFELTGCTFADCGINAVGSNGGAIYINYTVESSSIYTITACKFDDNLGSTGRDIYYVGDETSWNQARSNLGTSCSNCAFMPNSCSPTFFVWGSGCVSEIYITGESGDNNANCAAAVGRCGTLQYIFTSINGNYPFIGVGSVVITVSGAVLTRREETIIGDSLTAGGLQSSSGAGITVDNTSKLTLISLSLTHMGGEFLVAKGELYVTGCAVQSTSGSLSGSFLHLYEKGTAVVVGTTFSNLNFASGFNAIYTEGGILTLASSSFSNVKSSGNGGCVSARALSNQDVITIDDSCTFLNCAAGGNGGALYFNLTVGSPFVLLSTIFYQNTANGTGGAIHIDVNNHTEIGSFTFDRDVHFFSNKQNGATGANSSVHINIISQIPGKQFPCFTPLYNFSKYDYFNFDTWTVAATPGNGIRVTQSISAILDNCTGRCTDNSVADCPTTSGCWVVDNSCTIHPCLVNSENMEPPCSGTCVESDFEPVCIIDPCLQQYNATTCAAHSTEGCGVVNGRCIKASVSISPGGKSQIKNSIQKVPTSGKIILASGSYREYGITIGVKVVWIGATQSLTPAPTIAEDKDSSEPTASMFSVLSGGGLDLNYLTLTARAGFQNGPNCSLVLVTDGRLVLNYVTVENRWGTFCAIYAERPRETLIQNCNFRNITHDAAKGGAGLGINMLGENAYTFVSNTTFTDVWVQGTASNTRFGGALWLEAHGRGHVAEVSGCTFQRINTTDNAGALELYSDDQGGSMLCEHTVFIDCYTTKGGAGSSSRGRPVTFRNCTFTRCTAGTAGGALYNGGRDDNYIEKCTFTNCSCRKISNTYGGAAIDIYTSGTTIIADCVFDKCFVEPADNIAVNLQYVGGIAAVVSSFTNCTVSTCIFQHSYFPGGYVGRADAGALQIGSSNASTTLTIQGCVFENNTGKTGSDLDVGALMVFNSTLTLKNCSFTRNEGNVAGAVLLVNITISYIGNVNFSGNVLISPAKPGATFTGKDLVSNSTKNSAGSFTYGRTEILEYFCGISSGSVNISGLSTNPTSSDCYTAGGSGGSVTAGTANDISNQFERNLQGSLTISITTNILDFPPLPVSATTVVITSSSGSPVQLTYNNNRSNTFDVSTGTVTLKTVTVILKDLGDAFSFVRLSGNGVANLDAVSVQYDQGTGKLSNSGANGINSQVIYCEVGVVTIENTNFTGFIFNRTGNLIYFNPSSRASAKLNISNTKFTSIKFHNDAFGIDRNYPRFGLAVYAALLSSSSQLYLSTVSIADTHAAIAIIVPTLADVAVSFHTQTVTFDTQEKGHVYIGTQTDSVENPTQNDICSNQTLQDSLTGGGVISSNIWLCLGGATSCTLGETLSILETKARDCERAGNANIPCENDAHEYKNSDGLCMQKSCSIRRVNTSVARRCGVGCLLTENGLCVNQEQGCDDSSQFGENDVGQCVQNKQTETKKSNTGVVVAVVVIVVVVVVIAAVAVVIIVLYKIKSDRIKYKNMDQNLEQRKEPSQMVTINTTPSAAAAKTVTDVEEIEEDLEEEIM